MSDPTGADAFEALLHGGAETELLILVDDRLRILRAGRQAEGLADRPVETLRGMSMIAAFGSAALDAVARQALSQRSPVSGEADLGRLRTRRFVVDAVPLRDGGLVLSLRDVTAVRRIERVRTDFVANISHELRTPLASIRLLAETLSAGAVDDGATVRDFATQIEREADHLSQLVDELLDLSMIESGETHLTLEPLDPGVLVTECVQRIGPVAERREIRVVRQRASATDVRALADSARLGQALLNLAHNAVKFSRPGGEVRIGWEPLGDSVRFTIADDGIGVPEAHRARIFERFYKVDRSRTRSQPGDASPGGGAGLGLAIVRHIAEAHRGAVGLISREGAGSTFWIQVPQAEDDPGAAAAAGPPG